jgi:hypothetical protein
VASSIRLELTPVPAPGTTGTLLALTGFRITLRPFGKGISTAQRGSFQPAQIDFTGTFLKQIIGEQGPETSALGMLSGTISLGAQDGVPMFVVTGPLQNGTATDPADPTSSMHNRPRALAVDFEPTNFQFNASDGPFNLTLPVELEQAARHLEISAQLSPR